PDARARPDHDPSITGDRPLAHGRSPIGQPEYSRPDGSGCGDCAAWAIQPTPTKEIHMNTETAPCSCNPCIGESCTCGCRTPAATPSTCGCGCQSAAPCTCSPS